VAKVKEFVRRYVLNGVEFDISKLKSRKTKH